MDIPDSCIIAQGPEGLEKVLDELLAKAKADPIFASQEHNIMYQLGGQKSLIKVDTNVIPFKFWYNDLMGRPATTVVKDIIARFVWEKCGERERAQRETEGKKS